MSYGNNICLLTRTADLQNSYYDLQITNDSVMSDMYERCTIDVYLENGLPIDFESNPIGYDSSAHISVQYKATAVYCIVIGYIYISSSSCQ